MDQGSDKGGGVVQRLLVGTVQNAMHTVRNYKIQCVVPFLQLQNTEHNLFWLGKQFKISTTKSNASEV